MSRAWNILRATFSKTFCAVRDNFFVILSLQTLSMFIKKKIQIKKAQKITFKFTASEYLRA